MSKLPASNKIKIYLESADKRTFAGAIDWPGWCRSGRDEKSALDALLEYGKRYNRVISASGQGFHAPTQLSELKIIQRVKGNMTTNFGAPGIAPKSDARPVDEAELKRLQALLNACYREFVSAAKRAKGKKLSKGPRGGGRDLPHIVEHVLNANDAYLARVGWKHEKNQANRVASNQRALVNALTASAHGERPVQGPRGGVFWTPRYFVRRVAWHILDHTWEIEDRLMNQN